MAKFSRVAISLIVLVSSVAISTSKEESIFGVEMDKESMGFKREKLSHFRVYWQDILSGQNPSSVQIIPPEKSSQTAFGLTQMIDNPLTVAPGAGSKIVGRAQGFYVVASQQEVAFLMNMNFVFIEGKYNGSTITVLGRSPVYNSVREMPIVGGSGLFRFARGYVQARTKMFDLKTGDASVEYNIYVLLS